MSSFCVGVSGENSTCTKYKVRFGMEFLEPKRCVSKSVRNMLGRPVIFHPASSHFQIWCWRLGARKTTESCEHFYKYVYTRTRNASSLLLLCGAWCCRALATTLPC